jgi:hypothetical protein
MTESTRHRQAFDAYWQLGANRSIERLQGVLASAGVNVSLRTLYEWSSRYRWQDQLMRLEREARQQAERERIESLQEMYHRHTQEALLLQQKGAEWLTSLGVEQVTADAAIRAIAEGIRVERLVRGEVTERSEVEGNLALERISDEQLQHVLDLVEGLVGGEGAAAPR